MESNSVFIKSFNGGYLLAKYEPKLAMLIGKHLQGSSEYIAGLKEGITQFEHERFTLQQLALKQLRDRGRDHERCIE